MHVIPSRWRVVGLPLLAVLLAIVYGLTRPPIDPPSTDVLPSAREIPAFFMQRADGGELTRTHLLGRWSLIFSGYTSCPDICPVTLSLLSRVQHRVQPRLGVRTPQNLFVTMDPTRDTPEVMAGYVGHFDPAPVALLGSHEQLLVLTRALGFVKPQAAGFLSLGDAVAHSSAIALINPQGRLHALFRAPHEERSLARRLTNVILAHPQ